MDFDVFEKKFYGSLVPFFEELKYSEVRQEYVNRKQAITYFDSESKFKEAIFTNKVRMCFLVSITISVGRVVRLSDGYEPFWKDTLDIDDDGEEIRVMSDIPIQVAGWTKTIDYKNFNGYVSPVDKQNFLKALWGSSDKDLVLEKVYLIEPLETYKYDIYKEKEYFVNSEESITNTINISECYFLQSDLENFRSINNSSLEPCSEQLAEPIYDDSNVHGRIILGLRAKREEENKNKIDTTDLTKFYEVVPLKLIELGYQLDKLEDKKGGKPGARSKIKKWIVQEIPEFTNAKENTLNAYWTKLKIDIKNLNKNK